MSLKIKATKFCTAVSENITVIFSNKIMEMWAIAFL